MIGLSKITKERTDPDAVYWSSVNAAVTAKRKGKPLKKKKILGEKDWHPSRTQRIDRPPSNTHDPEVYMKEIQCRHLPLETGRACFNKRNGNLSNCFSHCFVKKAQGYGGGHKQAYTARAVATPSCCEELGENEPAASSLCAGQ